jgi:transglutaminase/protease-like cytokinesis protein 3
MKIQKTKTILLSLVLTTFMSSAHAQSASDLFAGFKKAATAAAEAAAKAGKTASASEDKIVNNSLLEISGQTTADTKWVMVLIKKGSFEEKISYEAKGGNYKFRVPLQDDAGIYDIELYKNSNENRYTSYSQFKRFKVENTDSRDMSFLLPTDKVQSDDPRIVELTKEITKDAQSDEEAFSAIYDFITKTIKYDFPAYNDGTYVNKDYNAINTLVNSMGVCEGYANLLAAMSRAYGIRTKVIFGKAQPSKNVTGNHGWNEVLINDEWKLVDATWDAGRKIPKYYFLDTEIFSQDHFKEKEMNY